MSIEFLADFTNSTIGAMPSSGWTSCSTSWFDGVMLLSEIEPPEQPTIETAMRTQAATATFAWGSIWLPEGDFSKLPQWGFFSRTFHIFLVLLIFKQKFALSKRFFGIIYLFYGAKGVTFLSIVMKTTVYCIGNVLKHSLRITFDQLSWALYVLEQIHHAKLTLARALLSRSFSYTLFILFPRQFNLRLATCFSLRPRLVSSLRKLMLLDSR